MRRFRGEHVYPVITLSDAFMNTRFGGRQRPHFEVKRWIKLGGERGEVEALPPPPQQTTALPLSEVREPSLKEEMGDEISPFDDPIPNLGKAESPKAAAAPPHPTARRNLKKPAKTSAKKPPPKRASNILDAG
jgi:hypothetical protein